MPEAVASNSIPTPSGLSGFTDRGTILDTLDDTVTALRALNEMIFVAVSQGDFRNHAEGMEILFRQQMDDLDDIREAVRGEFRKDSEREAVSDAIKKLTASVARSA